MKSPQRQPLLPFIYPFNGCIVFHCLEAQWNNLPSSNIYAFRLFWPLASKQSHNEHSWTHLPMCVDFFAYIWLWFYLILQKREADREIVSYESMVSVLEWRPYMTVETVRTVCSKQRIRNNMLRKWGTGMWLWNLRVANNSELEEEIKSLLWYLNKEHCWSLKNIFNLTGIWNTNLSLKEIVSLICKQLKDFLFWIILRLSLINVAN